MPAYPIQSESGIKEAIIRVIAFFDMFDHPLTAYEIMTQLDKKWSYDSIIGFLETAIRKSTAAPVGVNNVLARKNGFYFFVGREDIVETRQKRHNYSARKIKIARRFMRLFALWPSVKMIALANSLGQHNLRDGSDIDFFIVSAPRRVWLTRLYCTGLAKLANRRPNATSKRDKICLSFYVGADRLDLDDLRLPGSDPYFDHWRQSLVLLYNRSKTYEKFLAANGLSAAARNLGLDKSALHYKNGNKIGDKLELLAKKIQLAIMPAELKSLMNASDGVVINDSILKLYQRDRRREYAEKYEKKVAEILG